MEKNMITLLGNLFLKMNNGFLSAEDNSGVVRCKLYFRNNPDGTLRWVWPATSGKPVFLKFYNDASPRAGILARLIRILFRFRLQRLFASGGFYVLFDRDRHHSFLEKMGNDWALFAGTPGLSQAALFYGNGSFYKIPVGEHAKTLLQHEQQALRKWSAYSFGTIRVPVFEYQNGLLRQEDISAAGGRTPELTETHWRALAELSSVNQCTVSLQVLPAWKRSAQQLQELSASADPRIPKGLVKKLKLLMEGIGPETVIPASAAHGDFTPWNLFVAGDRLAMIDWELAMHCAPVFFDVFHFYYQQGSLVDHSSYTAVSARISDALSHDTAKHIMTKHGADAVLHEKLYLIFTATFYLNLYSRQQQWHPQVEMSLRFWNEAAGQQLSTNQLSKRQVFLYDLFDHLQQRPYAALKWLNTDAGSVPEDADIDLCIRKKDRKPLLTFLRKHPLTAKVKLHRKSFMYNFSVILKDDSFVSLDAIWMFKRKTTVMMEAAPVLANSTLNGSGIKRPAVEHDFAYTWLFYLLNHADVPERYRRHFSFFSQAWRTHLNQACPWVKRTGVHQYSDLYFFSETNRQLVMSDLQKMKANKGLSFLRHTLSYWLDAAREQFFQRGFIITFSGVDGAGKSTVIEKVKSQIEKKYRRKVVVLRHRPAVLPMLSAWKEGRKAAEQRAATRLPRQGNNSSTASSLLRFGYYYADYLLGQFYIQLKYVLRGYIVLYDRYYFDFINDGKRSNISLPAGLTGYGYHFLLKPKYNFFLYADPETILKRKKELDDQTIRTLTGNYLQLFSKLEATHRRSRYIPIRNEVLPQTLHTIFQHVNKTAI